MNNSDQHLKLPAQKKLKIRRSNELLDSSTGEQKNRIESNATTTTIMANLGQDKNTVSSDTNNEEVEYSDEAGASSDRQTLQNNKETGIVTSPTTSRPQQRFRSDGKKLVEKNSLVESDLVEAKNRLRMKRDHAEMITEEDKREERRAANRLSAFQSRQRRKVAIDSLQEEVEELRDENSQQSEEIIRLQQECQQLRQENGTLRTQLEAFPAALLPSERILIAATATAPPQPPPMMNTNHENSLLLDLLTATATSSSVTPRPAAFRHQQDTTAALLQQRSPPCNSSIPASPLTLNQLYLVSGQQVLPRTQTHTRCLLLQPPSPSSLLMQHSLAERLLLLQSDNVTTRPTNGNNNRSSVLQLHRQLAAVGGIPINQQQREEYKENEQNCR